MRMNIINHLTGNDTNIKGCNCAQGGRERERERERTIFCPKSVQSATCTFLVFDQVMDKLEMKHCAGMWVYRREVASFKR